jgi:Zn finger protein HypA/HybF involved in hydrogenase expression
MPNKSTREGIARALHQHNRRRFKPISKEETLEFDDLETPRCSECGSDLETTLFGLECPKCKEGKE